MASLDELTRKLDELLRRHAAVGQKKAELRRQLEAKKVELVALDQEIQAAVSLPRTQKEGSGCASREMKQLVSSFEEELKEVERALAAFDQE